MRNHISDIEDRDAPPSPRLKDYYEFKGAHLTDEERDELFCGDPFYLRRVFELATQPHSNSTRQVSLMPERVSDGR